MQVKLCQKAKQEVKLENKSRKGIIPRGFKNISKHVSFQHL